MLKTALLRLVTATFFLISFTAKPSAAADDLSGTWITSNAAGQRTIELSKSGDFKITLHDISELPPEKKFQDRSQMGTWRVSGNSSARNHLGSFGAQKRLYLKFDVDGHPKFQGYRYRMLLVGGEPTLELIGPGQAEAFGDELGIMPKPVSDSTLAERSGGYYQRLSGTFPTGSSPYVTIPTAERTDGLQIDATTPKEVPVDSGTAATVD
jgi:hypothetical protein